MSEFVGKTPSIRNHGYVNHVPNSPQTSDATFRFHGPSSNPFSTTVSHNNLEANYTFKGSNTPTFTHHFNPQMTESISDFSKHSKNQQLLVSQNPKSSNTFHNETHFHHQIATRLTQRHCLDVQRELGLMQNTLNQILSLPISFDPSTSKYFNQLQNHIQKASGSILEEIEMVRFASSVFVGKGTNTQNLTQPMFNHHQSFTNLPLAESEVIFSSQPVLASAPAIGLSSSMPQLLSERSLTRVETSSSKQLITRGDFMSNISDPKVKAILLTNPSFVKFGVRADQPAVRTSLPYIWIKEPQFSIFNFFKNSVGKDVSRMTTPVAISCPLSATQNIFHLLEHSKVLDQAAKQTNQYLRLGQVAAIYLLTVASISNSLKKPFNSLLSETSDLVTQGFRAVSEQISHNPPITVFTADSPLWQLEVVNEMNVKLQFGSACISTKGDMVVTLKTTGERFHIRRSKFIVNNLFFGKTYLWPEEETVITNENTGDVAVISFDPKKSDPVKNYGLKGSIKDRTGTVQYLIQGKWNHYLKAISSFTGEEFHIGSITPKTEDMKKEFFFSLFSKNLNNLTSELCSKIPKTDSRLRPDIRAFEHGDINLAEKEKFKLEETQRARLGNRSGEIQSNWFEVQRNQDGVLSAKLKSNYWEFRETGIWPSTLPDLYI